MVSEHFWEIIDTFITNEKYDTALRIIESAYGTDPDDVLTLSIMARLHYYLGNHEQASALLTRAMTKSAPFEMYWIVAIAMLTTGLTERAIAFWQAVETQGVASGYFDITDDFDIVEERKYINMRVNDCRAMLCTVFHQLGNKDLATHYKQVYLGNLEKGLSTCYDASILPE